MEICSIIFKIDCVGTIRRAAIYVLLEMQKLKILLLCPGEYPNFYGRFAVYCGMDAGGGPGMLTGTEPITLDQC